MGYKKEPFKAAPIEKDSMDDPYRRIAAEIIIGAVDDWRRLIENRAWETDGARFYSVGYIAFSEIRNFLKSDWCDFLAQFFDIEPARILEILEKELQEAMENDAKKQKKKRKRCNK